MSYVRYQCNHYNTSGAAVQWQVEIIDTTGSGTTKTFSISNDPEENWDGLPQDLKPGIYPTSYKIGFYAVDTTDDAFIDEVLSSDEGRFLVRLYKDFVLQFIGYILPDQCSYEDQYYPYIFFIEAVDGLHRLGTEDYAAQFGVITYLSVANHDFAAFTFDSTPIPVAGNGWTLIEHWSDHFPLTLQTVSKSTYARLEYYSLTSPGGGWIDEGNGLWVKAVSWTNEVVTTTGIIHYRLTRDIVSDPLKTVSEYLQECIAATGLSAQYGAAMYDQCSEWYENSMGSLTDDPFGQIRMSEFKFKNKTYQFVLQELCKLFYLRVYYSRGRYHIEQITTRVNVNPKRFVYNSAGGHLSTDTSSLDINVVTSLIMVGEGGRFKSLAALKEVRVTFNTDSSNLLDGYFWDDSRQGPRFLGTIKKEVADHLFRLSIPISFSSSFDATTMATLPLNLQALWAVHYGIVNVEVRLVSQTSSIVYYLDPGSFVIGTWETTQTDIEREILIGGDIPPFFTGNLVEEENTVVGLLSEALPENVGDLFDVYVSVHNKVRWKNPLGVFFWNSVHAGDFVHEFRTGDASLISRNNAGDDLNVKAEITYVLPNTVNNSLNVETTVIFGDVGSDKDRVEIHDGTNWVASNGWSLHGLGTPLDLPELLATEIMSLRLTPRKIYSTSWLTVIPSADNRLVKNGIFYLPLRVMRNGDMDAFSGEFLEIDKDIPPGVTVITVPVAQGPPHGFAPTDPGDEVLPEALVLETNEAVTTAPVNLTEIDIVNTLMIHAAIGSVARIVHPTNPDTWIEVVLTQAIEPTSTVMHFVEKSFIDNYPDASPIYIEPSLPTTIPTSTASIFTFDSYNYTGGTLEAPSYDWSALIGQGAMAISLRHELVREGIKMMWISGATAANGQYAYDFDIDGEEWIFPIPFQNERLNVKAW